MLKRRAAQLVECFRQVHTAHVVSSVQCHYITFAMCITVREDAFRQSGSARRSRPALTYLTPGPAPDEVNSESLAAAGCRLSQALTHDKNTTRLTKIHRRSIRQNPPHQSLGQTRPLRSKNPPAILDHCIAPRRLLTHQLTTPLTISLRTRQPLSDRVHTPAIDRPLTGSAHRRRTDVPLQRLPTAAPQAGAVTAECRESGDRPGACRGERGGPAGAGGRAAGEAAQAAGG